MSLETGRIGLLQLLGTADRSDFRFSMEDKVASEH